MVNNTNKRKLSDRNSNLELLRILSMLMIIAHHYAVHGFSFYSLPAGKSRYFVEFLSLGGKVGVVSFILISGYFMCTSTFSLRKFGRLLGQVLFYSVLLAGIFRFILTPVTPVTRRDLMGILLPAGCGSYWFMTDYLLLMILSPLLNLIIQHTEKKVLRNYLLLFVVLWSLMPTILRYPDYHFSSLGYLILLYFVGAYVRYYGPGNSLKPSLHFLLACIFWGLMILGTFYIISLGHPLEFATVILGSDHLSILNSTLVLLTALELFLGFLLKKPAHNPFINFIAQATLGVYLIHDNEFVRPWLWNTVFQNESMYGSPDLIFHAVFAIAAVFMVCTLIDLLRIYCLQKPITCLIRKISR